MPEYSKLADDGIGFLAADRGRDWSRKIKYLLERGQEYAELARMSVRVGYTYEGNSWRWHEAWAPPRGTVPICASRSESGAS